MNNEFDDILKETESVELTPVQEVKGTTQDLSVVPTPQKQEVVKTKEQVAREMGLVLPKNMGDMVLNSVMEYTSNNTLTLPSDYSVGNALKSAVLYLQQTVDKNGKSLMEVCTKTSIAQSMLEMVLQGLDPSAKQCYFIVRGDKLTMMRSYFGSMRTLKRLPNIKDVWATVVYKGDIFKTGIEKGRDIVLEHETCFENRDNEIIGGYAVIEKNNGEKVYTIMTKKEIDACWNKSSSTSKQVHKEYPQELTKRTLINRACKNYINSEVEDTTFVRAYNNTTDNEYNSVQDKVETIRYVKEATVIDV